MFFTKAEQRQNAGGSRARSRAARLHSIPALLKESRFEGAFELGGSKHRVVYAPARAEISGGKLKLQGKLSVIDSRGRARSLDGVSAVLASQQGGMGGLPRRLREREAATSQLPVTDATGPLSFCGVMYFHLQPLDARALGVRADLSRVQLNARLAPTDDTARDLHGLYSMAVAALYTDPADERAASAAISEINKVLGAV
ncbi:MAG TPA: hypothetical protein VNO14_04915 [Blastocatellia bacterium]|nr:hypothetical protein [Blastocatellia bacterium]